jgi:hypothetical protein
VVAFPHLLPDFRYPRASAQIIVSLLALERARELNLYQFVGVL